MRFLITVTSLLLIGLSFVNAQKNEVHLIYDVNMESPDPEVEAQIGMLAGSQLELFVKDQKSRQTMKMGSFTSTTTIIDSKTKKALILVDGMGGKLASLMEQKELEEMQGNNSDNEDFEFEFTDETKEILGYTCKKAYIEDESGNLTTYWYSEEIEAPKTETEYFKTSLPGMPLGFEIETPEITMIFTATELNHEVKNEKELFNMEIPEGYKTLNQEELRKMLGGVQ